MTASRVEGVADLAVATVAAKSYLPFARVLARSFRARHPGIPLIALLADRVEDCFDAAREPFDLVDLDAVGIPGLRHFLFRYKRREMAVAVKPFLLDHLLDRGYRRVLYLDADLWVLDDLTPVFAALAEHPILLTPHLLEPLAGADAAGRELEILRAGTFNNGVLGVAAHSEARRYLAWWRERLLWDCRLAPAEGFHHDQRWNDLAPALFEGVRVLRDPGVNVAYWNLRERPVERRGDRFEAAGRPLRLFHFSGFDPHRPERLSLHLPAGEDDATGAVGELCRSYAAELEAAEWAASRSWPYAFGCFEDGTPIPDVAREIYREQADAAQRFGDPFASAGAESFAAWVGRPEERAGAPVPALSRLWAGVLARRPDVRAAYPDPTGADRAGFLRWAHSSGAREHGIPARFLPAPSAQ